MFVLLVIVGRNLHRLSQSVYFAVVAVQLTELYCVRSVSIDENKNGFDLVCVESTIQSLHYLLELIKIQFATSVRVVGSIHLMQSKVFALENLIKLHKTAFSLELQLP